MCNIHVVIVIPAPSTHIFYVNLNHVPTYSVKYRTFIYYIRMEIKNPREW